MRDDAVLRRALPLDRGLVSYHALVILGIGKVILDLHWLRINTKIQSLPQRHPNVTPCPCLPCLVDIGWRVHELSCRENDRLTDRMTMTDKQQRSHKLRPGGGNVCNLTEMNSVAVYLQTVICDTLCLACVQLICFPPAQPSRRRK